MEPKSPSTIRRASSNVYGMARARVCRFSFLMVNMVITQLCVPCTYVLCSIRYHFTVPWFVHIYIYIRSISIYVHTAWTRQFSGSGKKERGKIVEWLCIYERLALVTLGKSRQFPPPSLISAVDDGLTSVSSSVHAFSTLFNGAIQGISEKERERENLDVNWKRALRREFDIYTYSRLMIERVRWGY